jgi:3-hydroxy-9,10-secoandrosta-1,3,5(10)-triene-9,17-dione monooxygenase
MRASAMTGTLITEAAPDREGAWTGLLDRARALVPLLRENALRTEQDRRMAPENLAALAEAGIFRLTLPRSLGGYEAPVGVQVAVLAELARGCGSTSWVASVYSVGTWLVALFPDEAQDEVFATTDVLVTVVATPSAVATPVAGGYRVTGRWAFSTGCIDAHWAFVGALEEGVDGPGAHRVLLIPYTELRIHDDWRVTGLAGTGSNSVSADGVFVPARRVLALQEQLAARYERPNRNSELPLYRIPRAPLIAANSLGAPLGLGLGALDAFLERLPGRGITFTGYTDQREAPVTHLQVGEAAMILDSARFHARRCAELVDRKAAAGEEYSVEERALVRMDLGWVTELARRATAILQEASGATAIHEEVPIQRIARDIQALALHGILNPKTNLELYGRVLCGLEPNTFLL